MSTALLAALDDIAGRLRESQKLYPGETGDFFENPRYAHLLVRNEEFTNLNALIKAELEERFGANSSKIRIFEAIDYPEYDSRKSVFYRYIEYLAKLRTFVMSALPEVPTAASSTISVTVHGNMIGSAVAGGDASIGSVDASTVTVDPAKIDELAALLADFIGNRELDTSQQAEKASIEASLDELKQQPQASPSTLRTVLGKIGSLAGDLVSKTSATLLGEAAKRLLFGLP